LKIASGFSRSINRDRKDLAAVDVEHHRRPVQQGAHGLRRALLHVPGLHHGEAGLGTHGGLHAGLEHDVEREGDVLAADGGNVLGQAGVELGGGDASQAAERHLGGLFDARVADAVALEVGAAIDLAVGEGGRGGLGVGGEELAAARGVALGAAAAGGGVGGGIAEDPVSKATDDVRGDALEGNDHLALGLEGARQGATVEGDLHRLVGVLAVAAIDDGEARKGREGEGLGEDPRLDLDRVERDLLEPEVAARKARFVADAGGQGVRLLELRDSRGGPLADRLELSGRQLNALGLRLGQFLVDATPLHSLLAFVQLLDDGVATGVEVAAGHGQGRREAVPASGQVRLQVREQAGLHLLALAGREFEPARAAIGSPRGDSRLLDGPLAVDGGKGDQHVVTRPVVGQHASLAVDDAASHGGRPSLADQPRLGLGAKVVGPGEGQAGELEEQRQRGDHRAHEQEQQTPMEHAGNQVAKEHPCGRMIEGPPLATGRFLRL
jgi:hypothetical protein